jgi:hypothetical protein
VCAAVVCALRLCVRCGCVCAAVVCALLLCVRCCCVCAAVAAAETLLTVAPVTEKTSTCNFLEQNTTIFCIKYINMEGGATVQGKRARRQIASRRLLIFGLRFLPALACEYTRQKAVGSQASPL